MNMNDWYARQILKEIYAEVSGLGRKKRPYLVGGIMSCFIRKMASEVGLEEWIILLQ